MNENGAEGMEDKEELTQKGMRERSRKSVRGR